MKKREYHAHTFDPDVYKKFKKQCNKISIKPSRMIEQLIRQYLGLDIVSAITPEWAEKVRGKLNAKKERA